MPLDDPTHTAPVPPDGAAPQRPNRRTRRITVAAVTALGLAAAGGVAAAAAPSGSSSAPSGSRSGATSGAPSGAPSGRPSGAPKGGPNGGPHGGPHPPSAPSRYDLDGTLTAASSGSVTVKSLFGTSRTYAVTSSTTVHRGASKLSASSLEVGDHVAVHATKSGSSYTAKDIDVRRAHIDGAVTSQSGGSVTVTDRDGFTRTIAVSSATKYTKDGKSADRSDVTTGAVVHAEGSVASDGTTLTATAVDVLTKEPAGPHPPR